MSKTFCPKVDMSVLKKPSVRQTSRTVIQSTDQTRVHLLKDASPGEVAAERRGYCAVVQTCNDDGGVNPHPERVRGPARPFSVRGPLLSFSLLRPLDVASVTSRSH
jgi:hypothetical protein